MSNVLGGFLGMLLVGLVLVVLYVVWQTYFIKSSYKKGMSKQKMNRLVLIFNLIFSIILIGVMAFYENNFKVGMLEWTDVIIFIALYIVLMLISFNRIDSIYSNKNKMKVVK